MREKAGERKEAQGNATRQDAGGPAIVSVIPDGKVKLADQPYFMDERDRVYKEKEAIEAYMEKAEKEMKNRRTDLERQLDRLEQEGKAVRAAAERRLERWREAEARPLTQPPAATGKDEGDRPKQRI